MGSRGDCRRSLVLVCRPIQELEALHDLLLLSPPCPPCATLATRIATPNDLPAVVLSKLSAGGPLPDVWTLLTAAVSYTHLTLPTTPYV